MSRTLLLLAIALVAPAIATAQIVAINLTPKHQVQTGDETSFIITPNVSTGYTASLFLKATCATLPNAEFRFAPSAINRPYLPTVMFVSVKGAREAGDHEIIVEAYNGPLSVVDTCTLSIAPRPAWKAYDCSNSPLPSDTVLGIAVASDGTAWIGTEKGLARFDGTTWTTFPELDTFADPFYRGVSRIAIDNQGTVWAMRLSTLLAYRDGAWEKVTPPVRGGRLLAAAPDGGIWLVGEGLLMYHAPDGSWSSMAGGEVPFTDIVSTIDVGPTGAIWVAATNGIHRFDGTYWTSYQPEDLTRSTYLENPNMTVGGDTAWITTHDGIVRIEPDTIIKIYRSEAVKAAPGPNPKLLRSDGKGTLWIGTGHYSALDANGAWQANGFGGLGRYDSTDYWYYTIGNSGLPSDWIHTLHVAPNGNLWVGTNKGVAMLDASLSPILAFDIVPTSVAAEHVTTMPPASVSPHPVAGGSTMHLTLPTAGLLTVTVHTLDGAMVHTVATGAADAGEHTLPLDLSTLPAATYLLRVSAGPWTTTRTIVVQR